MVEALSPEAITKAQKAFTPQPVSPPASTSNAQKLDVPAYLAKYGVKVGKTVQKGSSILYCLDCVFDSSHVNNESAIGQTPEGKLFYQCFHNSCKNHTWKEARQIISGNDPLFEKKNHFTLIESSPKTEKHPWSYVTHDEIFLKKPESKPIIDGLLYEDEPTIIYSEGGVGKSLLTQDIAMHLAAGKPDLWEKFSIPKHRTALFIQSENSWAAINQRTHLKSTGDPDLKRGFSNVFYPQIHESIQVAGFVTDEAFRNKIYELVKNIEKENECKIDLIIFDPLISFHDAEENDNSRMRTTLDFISEISARIKATPAVLHHANKQGGIRAASSIRDWARNVIKLTDATYRGQKRIKLENDKSNNHEPFQPFLLVMDENLNFQAIEISETASNKSRERGELVREALRLCESSVETKKELIEQYRELSGVKSDPTIHRHITEAVENEYIKKEYYTDSKKGFQKCRFFIE